MSATALALLRSCGPRSTRPATPSLVDELLKLGANPLARNKVGETALDWALRRGDTPAVAALRRAGASDEARVKASVEKALELLQRSGSQFARVSGCYSCHHQSLPQLALGIATDARTSGGRVSCESAGRSDDQPAEECPRAGAEESRSDP